MDIANALNNLLEKSEDGLAELRLQEAQLEREELEYNKLQVEIKDTEEAQAITQSVAKLVQEEAHTKITSIVTQALSNVFPDAYEFKVNFETKRGKTEAELVFERADKQFPPMDATGGGAIDVAAFALRLSCLLLARPRLTRTVILDEPFKFVSAQYHTAIRDMLEELSAKLKVQFIIVTHIEELKTGNIIQL